MWSTIGPAASITPAVTGSFNLMVSMPTANVLSGSRLIDGSYPFTIPHTRLVRLAT
jgi:hypothetical protein